MLFLCVYMSEHLSAVEGCVFGGVFTSRVSVAVLCVSLDAGLLCLGGRGIALGGCLGDFKKDVQPMCITQSPRRR